ncbi:MAG: Stk1 family PASTA domain-containing Ser/Thr kinase [Oscillospiraceae bacterium]|nr:Stk1 family PASTA domain-containing Ser/Thr kinase [Oscillospiraceae bacterium]
MDRYIGKFLGKRYEILERIGSGGMAVVYKAKCHWLNRFVAIKILKEDLAQDEEFRRRFHEESQAVAMLSHPNIVAIYDVSRSEDEAEPDYIVMELIEGITLKQYMQKRGGRLSWKEALHFSTQIMKGLAHAHERGIIHRDIKPHNIMVLRDGSVKVADFGIARLMSSAQNTMTQEALGSVHYISPEQARGSRVDARSDIYSAGVVLYEMLTGRLPYEGDSPVAVAIQHINSIPLSPRELDKSIPEAMEVITMKAMASAVEKRYVSAEAMLADLEEFRKNPNIKFDYTNEDLLLGEGDEPTQPIGANTPQVVPVRPVHAERYEERAKKQAKGAPKGGAKESKMEKPSKPHPRPRPEPEEDDEEYDEGGGGVQALIIILAVIVCLAGVGYFIWTNVLSGLTDPGTIYTVPNVIGYTLEEAQALPEVADNGFTIVEGRQVVSSDVEPGLIVEQNPKEGDVVKTGGQVITVDISIGGEGLKMPDLYNKDQRIAEPTLTAMGLIPKVETDYSEEVTRGSVMSQSPAADAPVEAGQEVIIVVSQGRKLQERTMIPLMNMTLEEATKALTDMNLRVGTVTPVPSELYEAGKICGQSIPGSSIVMEETVIDLEVSTGMEMVDPPDVSASPEPSTPVEPTPTPTPVARTSRRDVTVDLPNDRETVTVRVTVGGAIQIQDQVVETRMRMARFTVESSGVQQVIVYVDDVPVKDYTEDFGT